MRLVQSDEPCLGRDRRAGASGAGRERRHERPALRFQIAYPLRRVEDDTDASVGNQEGPGKTEI